MPLFRRRAADPEPLVLTVGVGSHRVIVGAADAGCALLDDVNDYESYIARRAGQGLNGRDGAAVLNAKMDYAELVDTMVSVLVLAFEELVEHEIVPADDVPPRPAAEKIRRDIATYEFIQDAFTRAQRRCEWSRRADSLLRERGVAVLWPLT
jgi:hypothetical protein